MITNLFGNLLLIQLPSTDVVTDYWLTDHRVDYQLLNNQFGYWIINYHTNFSMDY